MRIAVFLIVAVLLLGGLFYFLKPQDSSQSPSKTSVTPSVTTFPSEAGNSDKVATLVIENNALASGDETITLDEGDTVIITVTSDADDELHIHGYDQVVPLVANTPTQVTITATLSGRYPIEVHNTETEIAVLEVQPK